MNTKEVAEFLNVSEVTIVRWRRIGLPYDKIGYNTCRYNLEEVMQWVKNKK